MDREEKHSCKTNSRPLKSRKPSCQGRERLSGGRTGLTAEMAGEVCSIIFEEGARRGRGGSVGGKRLVEQEFLKFKF